MLELATHGLFKLWAGFPMDERSEDCLRFQNKLQEEESVLLLSMVSACPRSNEICKMVHNAPSGCVGIVLLAQNVASIKSTLQKKLKCWADH